jgi:tetratricopeptide (TPR) repeat protein
MCGGALFAQRIPPPPGGPPRGGPRNPREFPPVTPQNQLDAPYYFREVFDSTKIEDPPPGIYPPFVERSAAAARVRRAVERMLRDSATFAPELLEIESEMLSNEQQQQLRQRLQQVRNGLNGLVRNDPSATTPRSVGQRQSPLRLVAFQQDDEVEKAVQEIREAIEAGDYPAASEQAMTTLDAHPGEGRLWYLLGLVLYKQDENEQALICVETAIEVGLDRPSLHQLQGEILFALGRFQEAETALQNAPDDGRTAVTRAASLRELGRDREALQVANQALSKLDLTEEQNKALAATAHLVAAGAHLRSGNLESAISRANSATRLAGTQTEATADISQLAQDLGSVGSRTDPRQRGYAVYRQRGSKSYGITATPSVAYTSNGTFTRDAVPDAIFGADIYAWTRLAGDDESGVIAFANAGIDEYAKTRVSDYSMFDGGFDLYQAVGPWYFGGKAAYRYQIVADSPYANVLTGQLRTTYTQSEASRTGVTFQYDKRDFAFAVNPFENRNDSLYRLTLLQDLFFYAGNQYSGRAGAVRNLRLSPYVQVGWDNTIGPSSKNDFYELGLSGNWTVSRQLSFFGWANYNDRDFANPDVRTGFLYPRDDLHTSVGLGMTRYLSESAALSLTWNWFDQNSLVDQFDFNNHQLELSLVMYFP